MDLVFFRPIMDNQILPPEYIQLLFSNLDEMLQIHSQFNNVLKVKRHDSPVVGDIADVLLSMVSVCVWGGDKNQNSQWDMVPCISVGGYQHLVRPATYMYMEKVFMVMSRLCLRLEILVQN